MPMEDADMGGPSRGIAYDPDQNPEEKRRLRKTYRALHDGTRFVFYTSIQSPDTKFETP